MITKRLKDARLKAGLTQEQLGVKSGLDESTASARMNQYEKGVHTPDFDFVCKIAKILEIPACYFYTVNDELAEYILEFSAKKNIFP